MCCAPGRRLGPAKHVKAGRRFPLQEPGPTATIDAHEAALRVGSLDPEGLAVQVDRVGLHFRLNDFLG